MLQRWSGRAPAGRLPSGYEGAKVLLVVLGVPVRLPEAAAARAAQELMGAQYRTARLELVMAPYTSVRQRVNARRRRMRILELYLEAPTLIPSFEPA